MRTTATFIRLAVFSLVSSVGTSSALAADDSVYEITKTDAKGTPGAKAVASVTIKGKNGWHVNMEEGAPMALTLTPDAGLSVDKAKLARADLADKNKDAPRFDVAVTGAEPGKKTINAEAKFIMCQDTACKPVKEKIALNVEIAAAPAPAAAGKKK